MAELNEGHKLQIGAGDVLRRLGSNHQGQGRAFGIQRLERIVWVLADAGPLQEEALYHQLAGLVLDLLDVECCIVLRYDPATESLIGVAPAAECAPPPPAELPDTALQAVEGYRLFVEPSLRDHWQAGESLVLDSQQVASLGRQLGLAEPHSALLAGLPYEGGGLAVIQAMNKRDGSDFDDDDARMLSILGRQAAVAIENARLFERTERYVAEMASLYEMTAALASAAELDEMLAFVLDQVHRLLTYDACLISLATADGQTLRVEAVEGVDVEGLLGLEFPVDARAPMGINGWIYHHGQPVLIDDANADPRRLHIKGQTESIRAVVGAPLIADGQPIGTIYATRREACCFTPAHLRFLTITATQVAAAGQRARLLDRAQRRAAEMETMLSITTVLASTLDQDRILHTIYQQAGHIMDNSAFFVALYNSDSDELCFNLIYDRGERLESFAFRLSESDTGRLGQALTAHVVRHAQPLLIRNWQMERHTLSAPDGDLEHMEPGLAGDPTLSWLGVPIVVQDQVLGAIGAQSYQPYAFTLRHQRLLSAIANQAGISLQNARLLADLKLVNTDLQEMVATQAHLLQAIHQMVEAQHQAEQLDPEAAASHAEESFHA